MSFAYELGRMVGLRKMAALRKGAAGIPGVGAGPLNPPGNISNMLPGAPGGGAGMPGGAPTAGKRPDAPDVNRPKAGLPSGVGLKTQGGGAPPKPKGYEVKPGHKAIKPWGWS